jgi:hypothetical protein
MICTSLNLLRFIRPSPRQGRTLLISGGNLGAQTSLYPTPFRQPASPAIRPHHDFHRWLTGAQPSLTALALLKAMENLSDMKNYFFW